ncbi:hypothetical protein BRADI_1g76703v3 [Brachypodium distachyon]|uniref:Uncharacterized protein n=1 Tax=Brachypodium distachyon TaxID=15368 RepID=A0A2K2DVG7_BRADI|nr:hypothetical protein BRADI_1g76703v3 [Brachypodium distachyon]
MMRKMSFFVCRLFKMREIKSRRKKLSVCLEAKDRLERLGIFLGN